MNILIPTDLSDNSEHAIKFACSTFDKGNITLIYFGSGDSDVEKFTNGFKGLNPGIIFNYLIKNGSFDAVELNKIVDASNIDLTIIGTHVHETLFASVFGSRVSNLVTEIHCPVLIIPKEAEIKPIKIIGYACDLYRTKLELEKIIPFAQSFRSSIQIVHVHPVFPEYVNIEEFNKDETLSDLKTKLQFENLNLILVKTSGENKILNGLTSYFNEHNPDLLVMFTRRRTLLDKVLDQSKTAELVLESKTPVLSFPYSF